MLKLNQKKMAVCLPVLLAFCFSGCPESSDDDTVSYSVPQLTFRSGGTGGELKYSWTAIVPAGGITYKLYVLEGEQEAAEVLASGTALATGEGAQSGSIPGQTACAWYSAVVAAFKGDRRVAVSELKKAMAADTSVELRFGVISDTHIGAGAGAAVYPTSLRLSKVVDWYSKREGVKALAVVGDLTDGGENAQYDTFMQSWNTNKGNLQLIAVMGNHDAYPGAGVGNYLSADRFESKTRQTVNAHYVIDGYHFIVINGGRSGSLKRRQDLPPLTPGEQQNTGDDGDPFYAAIKDWTIQQIDAAKAAAPGKPIFLFLHHPLKNTFYVADEWYTSTFFDGETGVLDNYPEVVAFGAHIHSPNNDPRSIWQGKFTNVNTVTLHYLEMERTPELGRGAGTAQYLGDSGDGVTTSAYPKIGTKAAAQGMVITVNGSRVQIENFDFDAYGGYLAGGVSTSRVEQIPQTWTFDVSEPQNFPYTNAKRETQKTKPVFSANLAAGPVSGKVREVAKTGTTITVDFDQAVMPAPNDGNEIVHSYRFEFHNTVTGAIDRTAYQWSDFMYPPYMQKRTYEQLLGGLVRGTEYELRIYAIGSFQAVSEQYLTYTFTSG